MKKLLLVVIFLLASNVVQAQTSEQVFVQKIKMATDATEKKDFSAACFMFYSALGEQYALNNRKVYEKTQELTRRACSAAGVKLF